MDRRRARSFGYYALLTDDYPPTGIERAKPSGEQSSAPQVPPPPPSAA